MADNDTIRKLTAILDAELVGYSRLMGDDKQAAGLRERMETGEPFKWFAPYVDGQLITLAPIRQSH